MSSARAVILQLFEGCLFTLRVQWRLTYLKTALLVLVEVIPGNNGNMVYKSLRINRL